MATTLSTPTTLRTPTADELEDVLAALRRWQREDLLQLHPGDLGWHHLRGADLTAQNLRLWSRGSRPAALGMLDGHDLLRLAIAPQFAEDEPLARRLAEDLLDPERGILPSGQAFLEARSAFGLRTVLQEHGWSEGEAWVPLRRDLAEPVTVPETLTIEPVRQSTAGEYAEVHRSAFDSRSLTVERVLTMLDGPAHRDAASLLGRDETGNAVAVISVWSAGPGRPGLIEPLGVHRDHRGWGHGRAMCLAGTAQLRVMGASSATVCTPRALTGAVATYVSAGYRELGDVPDLQRLPAP